MLARNIEKKVFSLLDLPPQATFFIRKISIESSPKYSLFLPFLPVEHF